MKKCSILLFILFIAQSIVGQTNKNKREIKSVLNTFMECLTQKDSLKFYSLFQSNDLEGLKTIHKHSG